MNSSMKVEVRAATSSEDSPLGNLSFLSERGAYPPLFSVAEESEGGGAQLKGWPSASPQCCSRRRREVVRGGFAESGWCSSTWFAVVSARRSGEA